MMFLIQEEKNKMNNLNLLKIENLKMHINTYDGVVKAVDGVDLEVKTGEIVGIVGAVSYTHLTLPTTPYV